MLICFFALFIMCMIKVSNKTATFTHIALIRIVPFFGWIYKYSSTYQRMERKLISDEAIQRCECALESMSYTGGNPNPFKDGWGYFKNQFLKIEVSDETLDRRYTLVSNVLHKIQDHAESETKKNLRRKLIDIMNAKAFHEMELADFLREELLDKITRDSTHMESVVSQQTFETKIKRKTARIVGLQERLHQSDGQASAVSSIFDELSDMYR